MHMQDAIHTAVQENNFEARLCAWEYFIPFYFVFKKTNYARYGSYYLETLKAIENSYPGMNEMMNDVTCWYFCTGSRQIPFTNIDWSAWWIDDEQRCKNNWRNRSIYYEERFDIKMVSYTFRPSTSHKRTSKPLWLEHGSWNLFWSCRSSQILTTEKLVQEVTRIFVEDYINSFDNGIDKYTLVNISSGKPLKEEATEFLLSCPAVGKEKYKDFVNTWPHKKEIPVHDPIKRTKSKLLTIKSSSKETQNESKKKCWSKQRYFS